MRRKAITFNTHFISVWQDFMYNRGRGGQRIMKKGDGIKYVFKIVNLILKSLAEVHGVQGRAHPYHVSPSLAEVLKLSICCNFSLFFTNTWSSNFNQWAISTFSRLSILLVIDHRVPIPVSWEPFSDTFHVCFIYFYFISKIVFISKIEQICLLPGLHVSFFPRLLVNPLKSIKQ